jgi:hypothetical protein
MGDRMDLELLGAMLLGPDIGGHPGSRLDPSPRLLNLANRGLALRELRPLSRQHGDHPMILAGMRERLIHRVSEFHSSKIATFRPRPFELDPLRREGRSRARLDVFDPVDVLGPDLA